MLRILVISLVVANLLLLGFQDNKPGDKPETVTSQGVEGNPDIPTIHLFSEMIEDQDLLTGNRRCFSLGPFHSIEDRDDTRSGLLQMTSGISERETQALVEKGYWVFMPPYASLLIANQELLSLQALGLEDIGVIYNGEWKNAISLGYFLRQENANRRKKSLEEKGYSPLVRVQRQSEPRYWLDYEQNPGSELVTLDMTERPNDFMQRAVPCPQEDLFEFTQTRPQVPAIENEPGPEQLASTEEGGSGPGEGAGDDAEETAEPIAGEPEVLDTGGTDEPERDQLEAPVEAEATDLGPEQGEGLDIENNTDGESQEAVDTPTESAIKTEADGETATGPPE